MAERDTQVFPTLGELKRVHIVGVCGTLMGAFAAFLKRRGIRVTGSDQNVYPPMSDVLSRAGVELMSGYRTENLATQSPRPDLVVIGNVIQRTNPEAVEALSGGYVYTSLPEAMEKLMLGVTHNCVVAGTHGKTTTSSLLAFTLTHAGEEPNYFIGGVSQDLPFSFVADRIEPGAPFVLEGDEYDTAFWDKVPKFNHYLPDSVILTSVEFDHADIYVDLEAVVRAFEGLVDRIRPGGRLIACVDLPPTARAIARARTRNVPLIMYGAGPHGPAGDARFWPENIRVEGEYTHFEIREESVAQPVASLRLRLSGLHNVLNALAVWILCRERGMSEGAIAEGLARFQGVKRRQEERGEVRGVLVIDDFAHHPTAVRETLRALKLRYPERRLVAVFEPRSATSRRKVFQQEYGVAFDEAAVTVIAAPYDQSKIDASNQFSSDQLVEDLHARGRDAHLFRTVEEGVPQVARLARSGDLVAVLSNGGFGGFIPKLLDALKG